MNTKVTRRKALISLGALGLALPILQACGGSAPASPTAASQTSTQSSGQASTQSSTPASSQSSSQSSSSGQSVPAATAAPSGGAVSLAIATYAGPADEWQRDAAKQWQAKNPNVKLQVDQIVYNDMPKKQLAELATGTMQDVVFSGIKFFPYSAYKGAFRQIDDYVKSNNPGMDDFYPTAIDGASFDGKLYGLPYLLHPGNPALVVFNLDMLDKKGLKMPTDDWGVQDFVDYATKLTDTQNQVWGSNYFPNTYYDFCSLARTWGGDDISEDGKKFTFATDKNSVAAAQWAVDMRVKYKATPPRTQSQGTDFAAGKLASSMAGTYSVLGLGKTVAQKFKWDAVLFPKGPTGLRGYQAFVEMFSVYAKSKQPETAFNLISAETSKDTGVMAVTKYSYQPSARKSVWSDPEINKIHSIFGRALKWMSDVKGPFPMPYNLRYSELEDKWENVSQPLFYGEVAFDQGIQKVQSECEAIMEMGRP